MDGNLSQDFRLLYFISKTLGTMPLTWKKDIKSFKYNFIDKLYSCLLMTTCFILYLLSLIYSPQYLGIPGPRKYIVVCEHFLSLIIPFAASVIHILRIKNIEQLLIFFSKHVARNDLLHFIWFIPFLVGIIFCATTTIFSFNAYDIFGLETIIFVLTYVAHMSLVLQFFIFSLTARRIFVRINHSVFLISKYPVVSDRVKIVRNRTKLETSNNNNDIFLFLLQCRKEHNAACDLIEVINSSFNSQNLLVISYGFLAIIACLFSSIFEFMESKDIYIHAGIALTLWVVCHGLPILMLAASAELVVNEVRFCFITYVKFNLLS